MKRTIFKLVKPIIEHFPSLARSYRDWRDSAQLLRDPVPTGLGFRLAGNRSMETGLFEPDETRLVESILADTDVVVDVGANIGYYVCLARSRSNHVIAFEPIPLNVQLLLRNIAANGWTDGVEVFPVAVSDQCAVTAMFGGGTGASLVGGWAGASRNYVRYVPTTTLDTILNERLAGKRCLFIVDVEGAEASVLAGAEAQLGLTPKPLWMVEIIFSQQGGIGRNPRFLESFETFWRHGYHCWTADRHRRPVSEQMVREMAKTKVDTLGCTNFLFGDENSAAIVSG